MADGTSSVALLGATGCVPRAACSRLALCLYAFNTKRPWWRRQLETFSALLALCAGNSPVPGELPTQRLVMRSFDVFFDLRLYKRLSKPWWSWWFESPSHPLWRLCNGRENIADCIFMNENDSAWWKFHWSLFPVIQIKQSSTGSNYGLWYGHPLPVGCYPPHTIDMG